jgi:outer membrane autotransporter protein
VTLLTAGTCTIAADQAGNANFNAAPQVPQSFTVTAAALVVTAGATSGTQVGVSFGQSNPASGGVAPYTYVLASGSLPTGTALDVGTGTVSGTPTTAASFSYAIKATDSQGPPVTATGATVSGTIAKGAQTISFTAPATTSVSASPVSVSATATSGLGVTFTSTTLAVCTVSGNAVTLLTPGTCTIAADQAGNANTNAAGQVVQSFAVTAAAVIVFNPAPGALPGGAAGSSYSQTLAASGGTGPYTYSITSGALPSGLSLNTSTGQISGTPAATGSFSFSVSAKDVHTDTGTAAYLLAITAPSVIAVSSNVSATAGTTVSVDLTNGAVGGPFTGAQLLSLSPSSAGSVVITLGDTASISDAIVAELVSAGHYQLKFTPVSTFTGTAVATFTLSSVFGTSAPAKVAFVVSPRPDPAQDPNVIGVVNAQAQAAQHFASTQIANFNDQLEGLHDGCQQNGFNLSLSDSRNIGNDPLARAGVGDAAAAKTADDTFWRENLRGGLTVDGSGSGASSLPGASLPGASSNNRASGDGVGRRSDAVDKTRAPNSDKAKHDKPKNKSLGECEVAQRFAAWTGGSVTFGKISTGTNAGIGYISSGVSAGIDYWFSPSFTAGIGFGYGQDRSEVGTNGTVSKAFSTSAAVYGSWHPSRFTFVDAVIGYGIMDFDSSRFITSSNDFANGRRKGHQVFGSLTSGYEYRANGLLVSPYARLSASWSTLDAFTESSGGAFALNYGAQTMNSFTGGFGLRTAYQFKQSWGVITPRVRVEYAHEFDGVSHAAVGYADLGAGAASTLQIAPTGSDYVNAGIGADFSFASGWMVGIDYRTAFGQEKTPPQTLQMKLNGKF